MPSAQVAECDRLASIAADPDHYQATPVDYLGIDGGAVIDACQEPSHNTRRMGATGYNSVAGT